MDNIIKSYKLKHLKTKCKISKYLFKNFMYVIFMTKDIIHPSGGGGGVCVCGGGGVEVTI